MRYDEKIGHKPMDIVHPSNRLDCSLILGVICRKLTKKNPSVSKSLARKLRRAQLLRGHQQLRNGRDAICLALISLMA